MFARFFVHRSAGFLVPGTRSSQMMPCSVASSAARWARLIGADAFASMPSRIRDRAPVLSIMLRTMPCPVCMNSPYRSVSARMSSTPKLHAFTSASVEFAERVVWRRTFHAMAPPFRSATTPETQGSAPVWSKSASVARMILFRWS